MRKIALCTALVAILSSGTASAKNDFDALLGELTFGGSSNTGAQTLTLDNIASDNLAPAPTAQVAAQVPVADPVPPSQPEAIVMPQPDAVPDQSIVADPSTVAEPAIVAEPAPVTETPFCDSACSQQSSACCGGNQQCGGNRCGKCSLFDKDHGCNCVPHTPPNLPTSSFYEYFKSNSCNCRVWDGYQNRCIHSSKHSRGECDCFEPRKKRSWCLSELGCGLRKAGTGACNSNGCHELPACWKQDDCAGEATCAASAACSSPGCDG